MKRKNIICLLLIVLLCLSLLTGCSSTKDEGPIDASGSQAPAPPNTETSKPEKPTPSQPESKNTPIILNETIVTDRFEVTIKKIEFSYDVLPDDTSGYYNHYPADSGYVYVHIDTDIKNIQKQALPCDEIGSALVDYNDGFKYTAQIVPEDSSLGFTYAILTDIAPLETLGVRFLVNCPEEVETSENPVTVFMTLGNETYEYVLR